MIDVMKLYREFPVGPNWLKRCLEHIAAEAIASGWQPIKTAPKDKTILLSVPTWAGKWNKTLPLPGDFEPRDTGGFWVIYNADEAIQRVEPTHWMPLPAAPLPQSHEGKP